MLNYAVLTGWETLTQGARIIELRIFDASAVESSFAWLGCALTPHTAQYAITPYVPIWLINKMKKVIAIVFSCVIASTCLTSSYGQAIRTSPGDYSGDKEGFLAFIVKPLNFRSAI